MRGLIAPAAPAAAAVGSAAVAAAAVAIAACASSMPMGPVGVSPPRPTEHLPADAGVDASATGLPPALLQPMEQVTDRFVSTGHGEHFDATLWANAAARAAVDAGAPWPDGSAFAEQATLHDPRGGDRPVGWLVMEKHGGSWRYSALSTDGDVAGDAGVAPCATCHQQATDAVFLWPSPPPLGDR